MPDDVNLGDGNWILLTKDGQSMVSGMTIEEVLVFPDYVAAGEKPDRGDWRGPRPSIVQVTRRRS